jgi:DNA-binding transcriptional regulator YhcF (GntR family)
MFIEIDTASSEPIYIQLMNELKKAIVKNDLKIDEMLPSVRSLAGDLGVNMHTVNKAYNLLVDEEVLIKSQRGYSLNPDKHLSEELKEKIKVKLEELLVDIYIHDISVQQVKDWTETISSELEKEW